jgi:hypothetical protein
MQSTPVETRPVNRVLAVFEAGAALFELSPVATFEHLAKRLGSLREQFSGPLISVDVRIGAQVRPARRSGARDGAFAAPLKKNMSPSKGRVSDGTWIQGAC